MRLRVFGAPNCSTKYTYVGRWSRKYAYVTFYQLTCRISETVGKHAVAAGGRQVAFVIGGTRPTILHISQTLTLRGISG